MRNLRGGTTTRVDKHGKFKEGTSSNLKILPFKLTKCRLHTIHSTVNSFGRFCVPIVSVHLFFVKAGDGKLNGSLYQIYYCSQEQHKDGP